MRTVKERFNFLKELYKRLHSKHIDDRFNVFISGDFITAANFTEQIVAISTISENIVTAMALTHYVDSVLHEYGLRGCVYMNDYSNYVAMTDYFDDYFNKQAAGNYALAKAWLLFLNESKVS